MDDLGLARRDAESGKCSGSCDKHAGQVMVVRVKHIVSGHDWGYFAYCDTAIDEDRRRGLEVELLNPTSSQSPQPTPGSKT